MSDSSRPEPVLDQGKVAGAIAGAVVAVVGVVLLLLRGEGGDLSALELALEGALTAVMAAGATVAPIWRAWKARGKVTPLADPRDDDGTPLVVDLGDGATGAPYVAGVPLVDTRTPGEPGHAAPE